VSTHKWFLMFLSESDGNNIHGRENVNCISSLPLADRNDRLKNFWKI